MRRGGLGALLKYVGDWHTHLQNIEKLKMSRIIFIVAYFLGLTAMAQAKMEFDSDLRVMTFNVRYATANDGNNRWDMRKNAVRDFLLEENADIIGFQEAMLTQVEYFASVLPTHKFVSRGRRMDPRIDEAVPVFYNAQKFELIGGNTFWLSDTPNVPESSGWGNSIPRIATWVHLRHLATGRDMLFLNTHYDYQPNPSQLKGSLLISEFLRQQNIRNVIVAGDFNINEQHPAIPALRDNVFIPLFDSWRVINPTRTTGTWHDWTGRTDLDRIDFIFASKEGFTPVDSYIFANKVHNRWVSDHHPVVSDFVFKD